jgi:hypothetical protein
MHDVKTANTILHGIKRVDEGPAHVVHFIHKIRVERERAAMVVDAVDAIIEALLGTLASKDMNFVLPALKRGGQFGDVNAHAAHGDGMKRFPGEQSNAHKLVSLKINENKNPSLVARSENGATANAESFGNHKDGRKIISELMARALPSPAGAASVPLGHVLWA